MRPLPLLTLLPALAFCGCIHYNYQPSMLRVPLADTAGQGDVYAAAAATSAFFQGSVGGQYALLPHLTAGAQASAYSDLHPKEIRAVAIIGPGNLHAAHMQRDGFSIGANAGGVWQLGRTALHLQAGADYERNRRDCLLPRDGYSDASLTQARNSATYLKPWVQVSTRVRLRPAAGSDPNRQRCLVLGLRLNRFMLQQSRSSIGDANAIRANMGEGLQKPPASVATMGDALVGIEIGKGRLHTFGHLQVALGANTLQWQNGPTFTYRFGLAYRLGGRR